MLLPFAIVIIVIFIIGALVLIIRKSGGKKEINKNPEVSGNERKIEKPGKGTTTRK